MIKRRPLAARQRGVSRKAPPVAPYFLKVYGSALGHVPVFEVAEQTHSHTPAHDGDAEITQTSRRLVATTLGAAAKVREKEAGLGIHH